MYSTVDEIQNTIPRLRDATSISSKDIAGFIGMADSVINAAISKRYTVPQSGVPLLNTISIDLSCYYLLTRRILAQEKKGESLWPDRYKEALGLLQDIAKGELQLVDASGEVITQREDMILIESNTQDLDPTFSEKDFTDSYVDPEKIPWNGPR